MEPTTALIELEQQTYAIDHAGAVRATDHLNSIQRLKKKFEEGKSEELRPLREQLDERRRFWDAFIARCAQIELRLKSILLDWRLREEQSRRDAAQAAVDAERVVAAAEARADAQAAGLPAAEAEAIAESVGRGAAQRAAEMIAPAPVPTTVAGEHGRASVRTDWTFEVVDINLVPREYMSVDLVAIGRVVKAHKGQIEIPGVRVVMRETIVGRSR